MKTQYLLCIALGISISSVAQHNYKPVPAYDTGIVNTNLASAFYTADGTQNYNSSNLPAYFVPKDSLRATILCGSLWVGGLDAGHQLHIAAQTYHQNGTDFWPGPSMNTYSTHEDTAWNHVWVISKSTIDSFRQGKFGLHIPASILNWPGNGNTSLGEMETLAPYVDSNHNGIYDPSGGDYPLIRGDEALYTIFNDARNIHTESGGLPLGIEVHQMAYQFKSADTAINEATFIHYDIYNHSTNAYDSVYFSNWIDMDVGNGGDNFIGCDSANNYWYTYCGHMFNADGSGQFPGENGYHALPPAQSLAYMCDTMTHFVYYNNDFTVKGNPTTTGWYYNYMKSLWGDSTRNTYAGNGYGGTKPSNYAYSGNPLTGTGWSEVSAGDPAGDRRGISSTGPYTFNPGERKSLDVALVFSQSFPGNNLGSVALSRVYVNDVRNFYNSQSYGCDENLLGVPLITSSNNAADNVDVYPNPSSGIVNGKLLLTINEKTHLEVYNVLGEQVKQGTINNSKFTIDLTNQPNGVYLYRLITENGDLIGEGKLVIQK